MDRSPGFGSAACNLRAVYTRFPFGSGAELLNHAAYSNSPDHSTKGTTSRLNALCVLVNMEFQVLFHSALAVLFTFPSRYFFTIGHQVVFRLGGWSPRIPCGFLVSAGTLDTRCLPLDSPTRLSLCPAGLPIPFGSLWDNVCGPYPAGIAARGLASSAFARHYSRNLG